jgi:hypothetical protein
MIQGLRNLIKHGFGGNPPANAFESGLDPLAVFLRVRNIDVLAVAFPIANFCVSLFVFHDSLQLHKICVLKI